MKKRWELLLKLLGELIERIPENMIVDAADGILDALEKAAGKTENTLDDALVQKVRDALQIPDGDD